MIASIHQTQNRYIQQPDLRIITTAFVFIHMTFNSPGHSLSLQPSMTRCIHSMLASRVLLHIREHGNRNNDVTIGTIESGLVFRHSEAVKSGV